MSTDDNSTPPEGLTNHDLNQMYEEVLKLRLQIKEAHARTRRNVSSVQQTWGVARTLGTGN